MGALIQDGVIGAGTNKSPGGSIVDAPLLTATDDTMGNELLWIVRTSDGIGKPDDDAGRQSAKCTEGAVVFRTYGVLLCVGRKTDGLFGGGLHGSVEKIGVC